MKNFAFWVTATALIGGIVATASGTGDEGGMPDLDGAVAWLNSASLSSKALRGKVVLVNFRTYSCINSLRDLPYMKAWATKYKDAGLVPIDSNHSIWTGFRNEYWPADYFIEAMGRIRYHHFGEGEYDKSERVIQTLLKENAWTRA